MDYRIGDTGMWARVDGPSVAERMAEGGVVLGKCKKDRSAGYLEICTRLAQGKFFATSDCRHFWRTFPSLALDEKHPERGYDTSQEDHCADEVMYSVMSSPDPISEGTRNWNEFRRARQSSGTEDRDPYRIKPIFNKK